MDRQQTYAKGDNVRWNEAYLLSRAVEERIALRAQTGHVMEVVGQLHDGGGDVLRVQMHTGDVRVVMVLAYNLRGAS